MEWGGSRGWVRQRTLCETTATYDVFDSYWRHPLAYSPFLLHPSYKLSVTLHIEVPSAITSVTVPSHAMAAVTQGASLPGNDANSKAVVALGLEGGVGLGTDFVVVVAQEQPNQVRV